MSDQGNPVARVAESVREVRAFDPGLGAYNFGNLGEAVRFSELMSKAGAMVPAHCRNAPALCLAVTMRAIHWKIDPFALAMETYQPNDSAPIGYQAKAFVTALRQCAGIRLKYRYEGSIKRTGKPVTSHNGKQIAPNGYTGDLRCIAYAVVDGEELTYETPPYDEITPKNSPLWHNDARQQLAYYAARGWTRLHEPGVMMGAYSADEVEEMAMRDVTPAGEGKPASLSALAAQARLKASKPEEQPRENVTLEPHYSADEGDEQIEQAAGDEPEKADPAAQGQSRDEGQAETKVDWFALRDTIKSDMEEGGVEATLNFYGEPLAEMKRACPTAYSDVMQAAKAKLAEEGAA